MEVVHPNLNFEHNFVFPVFQRHASMFESEPFERYNYNFKWTISVFWYLDMFCDAGWKKWLPPKQTNIMKLCIVEQRKRMKS